MNRLKKVSILAIGGIILLATISFATIGIVNAPNGLVLREGPSKDSDPITTVTDESKIEILEKNGEWYKVKYNDEEGYLFAEYVKVDETEEKADENNTESESPENTAQEENNNSENTNSQKVNSDTKIYTIPSITGRTLFSIKKDSEITINYELNNWINVSYKGSTGWIRKYFLTETKKQSQTTDETSKQDENKADEKTTTTDKKGYINVSSYANIRKEASTSSEIVDTLSRNTEVTITGEEGDFYKIKYQDITGYVSKSLISDTKLAEVTSRSSTTRTSTVASKTTQNNSAKTSNDTKNPNTTTSASTSNKNNTTTNTSKSATTVTSNAASSSAGSKIVETAKKYIGYKYVYGGSNPSTGFDCSGFAQYVLSACGYSVGRTCQAQMNYGTAVSRANLAPGDLIFFCNGSGGSIGHVAIYMGGGQIVHSANSRTGVTTDSINSGYYNRYYYTARRIAN